MKERKRAPDADVATDIDREALAERAVVGVAGDSDRVGRGGQARGQADMAVDPAEALAEPKQRPVVRACADAGAAVRLQGAVRDNFGAGGGPGLLRSGDVEGDDGAAALRGRDLAEHVLDGERVAVVDQEGGRIFAVRSIDDPDRSEERSRRRGDGPPIVRPEDERVAPADRRDEEQTEESNEHRPHGGRSGKAASLTVFH